MTDIIETEATLEAPAEAEEAAPAAEAPGARARWRRRLRAGAWLLAGLVLLAVALLVQTGPGQRLVVDRVLELVQGALAEPLVVQEVRSATLLTGVTLTGVRLDAAGGRPFLRADSVALRYSPLSLAFGTPRLRSATIYGLGVEISRYAGDDFLNVERLLAERPPRPDSVPRPAPGTIGLGRVSVRGGLVEVLTPAEGGSSARTVPGPDGSPLRRIAFEIEDLDLEETMLRPGGAVVVDARLASFTAEISLLERPLQVRETFGRIAFGARGLEVTEAALRLPGTLLNGDLRFGPERVEGPWVFAADFRTDGWGDLADLQWVEPRIPDGRVRGGLSLRVEDELSVRLAALEAQLEASQIVATGGIRFAAAPVLENLRVTANPLAVTRLEPWIGTDLPLDGFLSGQATFSGSLSALSSTGRLTFVPAGSGGAPTTAQFSGTVHAGDDPGATGLSIRFDPLNYRLLETYWPDARALGSGSVSLEVNGRASRGLQVVADVSVDPEPAARTRWVGSAELRRQDGVWSSVARGDFAPLSLPLLGRVWPDLQLAGTATGPVRWEGPMDDLRIAGDLALAGGRLQFEGSVAGASRYSLEAEAEGVRLSAYTGRLPEPSVLSASVTLEGSGFTPEALEGSATVAVRDSRVGPAEIESAMARLRVADGVLIADTLDTVVSGARLAGSGSLGLVPDASGAARLAFDVPSLLALRPIFMGDSILVRDELNPLEQELLRVRGIDPDTLPSSMDVRMAGSASGTADVRGRFGDFELDLLFEMADAAYGPDEISSATVSLSASDLPATFGDWSVNARALGVAWAGREFERVDFGGRMSQRRGEGTVDIQRRRTERYFLTGAFAIDSVGGWADLTDASIQINDLSWVLSDPTRIAWSPSSLSVDSLEVVAVGDDPMRVTASGTLTRGGDSDFRLVLAGFHIEDALQIAQREDVEVAGHVDLDLTVLGPSERPSIRAEFNVEDPTYGPVGLTRVTGSLRYQDGTSDFAVQGWSGQRSVLTASGALPYNLALTDVEDRTVAQPMDIRVRADSLEAATALSYLSSLRDVRGIMSADFRVQGTGRDPQPSGSVRLADGAWTFDALGVRHSGITGEILLRPDRTLTVKLATTGSGTSSVTGFVTLDELANPTLDLSVSFDRFLAVDRIDMESTISGEFLLTGRYRLPVAAGSLRVDEGTLFVEEFARAAEVVDLSDPMLYADGFAVDTTVFVSQPLLAGLRNPFLDNLRVDIDLSVPRNMWLRSDEMNVEMGGELLVRYDRRVGDLVLIGELQALRGSYVLFGRTFEVTGGTVAFIGQPGVNPNLGIQARSRIRRRDNDPLEVQATVEGTLIQPVVSLSSEESGLAQSDLISYLVFGVSSGQLGLGGAGNTGLGQDLVLESGLGLATGALANQVGAMLGQNVGLDYVAVSQANVLGDQNIATNFLSSAQLELGRYLGEDVFVVLVISRPNGQATSANEGLSGVNFIRGMRVEWALTDNTFIEGFIEDRFLRSGTGGLGASGLAGDRVVGALVIREWGYGSQP